MTTNEVEILVPGISAAGVFQEATPILVGRAGECTIQLADPRVSRRHALFTPLSNAIQVRDLGSKNGTHVAGARLRDGEATAPLPAIVEIGPYSIVVRPANADTNDTLAERPQTGSVAVDKETHAIRVHDQLIDRLSPQEFCLLQTLAEQYPRVAPSDELGDSIWGAGHWDRYMLHNLVRRTRRRLEAELDAPCDPIRTVRGVGYQLA